MTGAQLLVDLANQLVFEYSGQGLPTSPTPNLVINFTQPLLRGGLGADRHPAAVGPGAGVLYPPAQLRHFRREFYVG